jgi:hypothetical protein
MVSQGAGVLIFMVGGLVVAFVLGGLEVRSFLEVDRNASPEVRLAARGRLVRRGLGAIMLAGGVILARYLVLQDGASITVRLVRMGGCLALCVGLLLLAIWDFRIVRREIQGEFQEFQTQSLEDLQKHLERVAAENPELARQLPEILARTAEVDAGGARGEDAWGGKAGQGQ